MKRTNRIEAHLVELKQEIPELRVSQEERLSGGFLGVSDATTGSGEDGESSININLANLLDCSCCETNQNCDCVTTTTKKVG